MLAAMASPKQKNNLPLLVVTLSGTVLNMNTKANELVLTALQHVVGATLKKWLDENKAEVLHALSAAATERQMTSQRAKGPEEKRQPQFLSTAELAARWQLHRESVRRLVRQGRLPRMYAVRRILVPLSAVMDYEKQSTIPSRG
jgi:hypothetical protein